MLPYESIKEENSIEKNFCEPLSKCKTYPMDDEMTEIFLSFATSKEENVDVEKAKKNIWQFEAFEKRVNNFLNFTADNRVKIFMVMQTNGVIGKLVMYCYYMQYLCKKNNIKHITWENFSMDFFPNGFFSDEDLKKVWDGQKITKTDTEGKSHLGSDNLLDYQMASKSILF